MVIWPYPYMWWYPRILLCPAYHKYPRLIINPQDLSTSPKLYTGHIYGGSTLGRACAPASWAIWPLRDSEPNIREMLSLPLCSGRDPAAFSRDSVNLKWSGQCKGPRWRVIDRCEFPIPAFYKVAENTKKIIIMICRNVWVCLKKIRKVFTDLVFLKQEDMPGAS